MIVVDQLELARGRWSLAPHPVFEPEYLNAFLVPTYYKTYKPIYINQLKALPRLTLHVSTRTLEPLPVTH
jgi:hypothetical protein